MRVLHIVTAFPRTPDDVIAPWLVELLRRLGGRGHGMEVLAPAYRAGADHQYDGIPVHRFRYFPARWERLTHEETAPDRMKRSMLYAIMPAFLIGAGMVAAFRLARRERYDVIHVHWPMPMALLGWAAMRGARAPMVTTFYGIELRWVASRLPMLRRLVRWAARRSAQVVAISSYTAGEVRRFADVPIEVIPYTAEPRSLPVPRSDGDRRDGGLRVLFVGRLIERKGVDVLVRAIQLLPDEVRASASIVGEGPERVKLERLAAEAGIADRIGFRGQVSDEELCAEYARADVFVLPSVLDSRGDTEGLGVVLLEAMNYAVPVVASRIGGITDIVQHDRTGLLVPPADAAALADALRRVAADRGLASRLGAAGQRHVREAFGWDSIVDRWEALYARVGTRAAGR